MKRLSLVLATVFALVGCNEVSTQPAQKNIQAQKAAEAANSINFAENAEIENIKRRLELTSSPGALGFIVLLNQSGQPILYGASGARSRPAPSV